MITLIAVLITVFVFGFLIAANFGYSSQWAGYSPHLGGCLLATASLLALAAIGLMRLGAWLL